ncbi:hypothetical protein SGQ83_17445 [Flavobacterium sp. Fl-318]|uniref:Uncharacterized protein n=1 Tax=Flavobacterium cupriresistens TaxID=2893885 RepID=A0ABU4REW8_9FLAO|nr:MULTISPECIES: hypothetical protein [unclassified Flavobacterium]MDX6191144.1 hypothetical protein [Flavobacterium sp. Fl-318]UFH42536.1 hypothetical protein LNP23_22355 [Flavobacterium sp. F-323]
MDNYLLDDCIQCTRLKTKRRKKRLVKEDFEKQLVQLSKRKSALYLAIRNLPLIELKEPYQKGWVRFFAVRVDVLRSAEGVFYEKILAKINTFQFSSQKEFTTRKKRFGKKAVYPREQFVANISISDWNTNKFELTDKEKSCFTLIEKWSELYNRFVRYYKFNEPWRFVFKIEVNIITHKKAVDAGLESELKLIENYIQNRNLGWKIYKTRSKGDYYYWSLEKVKHNNDLKTTNLNTIYEMYLEEKHI